MKLVEILAREMKVWPQTVDAFVQDKEVYPQCVWAMCGPKRNLRNLGGEWNPGRDVWPVHDFTYTSKFLASDHSTAIVTREMWQAAKDKLEGKNVKKPKANKDGWIRHRGGKCPVEDGALVDVRFRSGIIKTACDSLSFRWNHTGHQGDIMAFRPHVAIAEQSSDASGRSSSATTTVDHESGIVSLEVVSGPRSVDAEWKEESAGPYEWRDRIHEIDAEQKAEVERHCQAMNAYDAERAELVQKLAQEGLALLDKANSLMDAVEERHIVPDEDMSDWRNWKTGDLVSTGRDPGGYPELSNGVHKIGIDQDDQECPVAIRGLWFTADEVERDLKWHGRPTA